MDQNPDNGNLKLLVFRHRWKHFGSKHFRMQASIWTLEHHLGTFAYNSLQFIALHVSVLQLAFACQVLGSVIQETHAAGGNGVQCAV